MYDIETLNSSLTADFILSLYSFQCKKAQKNLTLGPEWVKTVQEGLSDFFGMELAQAGMIGDWDILLLLSMLYTTNSNDLGNETEGFIQWLDGLPIGEMYELLSPFTNTFPRDLNSERCQFVTLLDQWNTEYYSKMHGPLLYFKQELLSCGRERSGGEKSQDILAERGPKWIEHMTNGLWFDEVDGLNKIVMIPQFHYHPSSYVMAFRETTFCHYPIKLPSFDSSQPSMELTLMTKSLSVDSRLRMLKYLWSGPKKFSDIVRHLGLAKGITHEHLLNLRKSGFVRTHMTGDTATHYSLREDSVQRLKEELERYLEQ